MKHFLMGLAACAVLVTPAFAATVTQSHSLSSGTGSRYGSFDFSSIFADADAAGYDVVVNSARFSMSGYSDYDRDYTRYFDGQYSDRDCGWFSCSTHYWDQYTAYDGDRTSEGMYGYISNQYTLYDTTYSGSYTVSNNYNATIGGRHAHIRTYTYSGNYGSMSDSELINSTALGDLQDDGMVAYRIYTNGDPTRSVMASLTMDYDLVARVVPLPASGLMLLGALGAIGIARRKRKSS